MSSFSEEYPARLKATLANFRSYCQKNSKSAVRLSSQKAFNTTITRYRSIREVKMLENKHDFLVKSPPKRVGQHPIPKTEEESPLLKSSDLIEMIRIKLKDSEGSKVKKMKTQANGKEDHAHHRYNKKGVEMAAYLLKTVKFAKNARKKKLDLAVSNTKCELLPRQEKPEKYKEVVIALKSRPASAIAYRTTAGSLPSEKKLDYKFSSPEPQRPLLTDPKCYRKSTECQKTKELSGWQIPDFQQSYFEPGGNSEGKSLSRKKKKLRRKD